MQVKVLLVCLGNICRSPTAHAVLRHKVKLGGYPVEIESAGTSASHRGNPPDSRCVREGNAAGYDFSNIYSRPVQVNDFAYFDLILAMDEDNLRDLTRRCPQQFRHKLGLFMQFHPDYPQLTEVPDPYYGGRKGFQLVLDLIEQSSEPLLQHLVKQVVA